MVTPPPPKYCKSISSTFGPLFCNPSPMKILVSIFSALFDIPFVNPLLLPPKYVSPFLALLDFHFVHPLPPLMLMSCDLWAIYVYPVADSDPVTPAMHVGNTDCYIYMKFYSIYIHGTCIRACPSRISAILSHY